MAMGVGDPRFRQWEKLRRDRFNELLGELAQLLPGYSPCPGITSSSSSEATNTPGALKWSKKEIVERAIHRIQSLEQKQPNQRGFSPRLDEEMPDEDNNEERNALKKKMHALMKQNRKLRELIRIEFQIDLSETEFKKLNVREIKEVIDCVQRDRGKKSASDGHLFGSTSVSRNKFRVKYGAWLELPTFRPASPIASIKDLSRQL